MSMHWQQMSTAEKIEAVKTIWQPGMSANQIAANFNGATRNAVIGMYGRYPDLLNDTPLKRPTASVIAMVKAKVRRRIAPSAKRPGAHVECLFEEPQSEWHVCGKPLVRLGAKQCKWPVNDAAAAEMHLFCSAPAEGSYCAAHAKRSINLRSAR
jgi:hypothetical protein